MACRTITTRDGLTLFLEVSKSRRGKPQLTKEVRERQLAALMMTSPSPQFTGIVAGDYNVPVPQPEQPQK